MDHTNIIGDLQKWMESHLDRPLLLDQVATKSGYSKWHLQRVFREVAGVTLGSYIRHRRLSNAATELCSGEKSVLNIALEHGFDSQPSFSRAFKKEFGQSPAAYRRTHPDAEGAVCTLLTERSEPVRRTNSTPRYQNRFPLSSKTICTGPNCP